MSTQERFAELWTDFLEGDLDENGLTELRKLLAEDEGLFESAVDMFQTHRLLGLIVAEEPLQQNEFVRSTMQKLPETEEQFVSQVMSNVHQAGLSRPDDNRSRTRHKSNTGFWMASTTTLILVFVLLFAFWPQRNDQEQDSTTPVASEDVRLENISHAKFFGELSPPVGSVLSPLREYVLMSGLIEVAFPTGASAIIEGPAVFKVLSEESLALDAGHCSIHAPDGAEGFRIETPATRVVDRGTRFTVNVNETNETEVQVIEGAADIYERRETASDTADLAAVSTDTEFRLTIGEARTFASSKIFATDTIPFDSSSYRHELPDRVVSYNTTMAKGGGAENLVSVTVKRNGELKKYQYEELIPCKVIWCKTTSPGAFLCGGKMVPTSPEELASDRSLITGVINPGGNRQPLTTSPIMQVESGTPGLAVRFSEPVINGPGADVLLFDLQTFTNPPDGDAFHVSPLQFREGLKSLTIRKYDLTMVSPNARDLTDIYIHMFDKPVDSYAMLETAPTTPRFGGLKFRGLVVGIDLSKLGYAAGESVEGLFFQDAQDDKHFVDPVYIGGLPVLK